MKDLTTVFWKEWREIIFQPGGRSKYGIILYIGIMGVVLPLIQGPEWIHSSRFKIFIFAGPLFAILSVVADSFAGEKERHTLETLLASRLPDSSILLGKIGTIVSYSLVVGLLPFFLGLIVTGIKYGNMNLMPFPLGLLTIALVLSILCAFFISCVGVLVSLWASTVKQAQQTMSYGMIGLLTIPAFGSKYIPGNWKEVFLNLFSGDDITQILLKVTAAISLINLLFIFYTLNRFKRSILIS